MTGQELLAEGRKLAKPAVYLRRRRAEPTIAIWGGKGLVPPPKGPYRHWITLDCRKLPQELTGLRRLGLVSVYSDEDDLHGGVAVHSRSVEFAIPNPRSLELSAQVVTALPVIDAVFLLGSKHVRRWLASNKWQPEWLYNSNFPDRAPVEEYERAYWAESAFENPRVYAAVGGWHHPWPDENWDRRVDQQILLCTFRDSEPWVEVWNRRGRLEVVQRIT